MAKSMLRLKAREMRKQGWGIKTIAHSLNVSSSTVSIWCRDIQLTPLQIIELERRSHDPFYGKRLHHVRKQQAARAERIKMLLQKGVNSVGKLTEKELFTAGISLYWAEGFKKDSQAGFANSDPFMIKFFLYWLETCCKISKERIKLRVGVNEQYKNKISKIEEFWSQLLEIDKSQFQKPFFQKVLWKKVYDNPDDYHGVLRIRITKSTELLRLIHGWIEGLKYNLR